MALRSRLGFVVVFWREAWPWRAVLRPSPPAAPVARAFPLFEMTWHAHSFGTARSGFSHLRLRQQRPNDLPLAVRQIAGISLFLVHAGITPMRSIADSLKKSTIGIEHRESERKVSGQRLLFVTNVHVLFLRFGEAIPEQCRVQARGGSITCDIVRRKGAEAIDERRDCGLPIGRILGIKPTVHYFSKLASSVRSDPQDGEADHSLRCVNRPARKARQWTPKKVIEQQVVTLARHDAQWRLS